MKVVSNSSTLIAFARIGHLWILEKEIDELIVPETVYYDLMIKGAGKPGSRGMKEANWIKKEKVKARETVERLRSRLHTGESEAIVLAKEIGAKFVILDDEEARKVAEAEGLKVVGGLSLLVQAKAKSGKGQGLDQKCKTSPGPT